MTVSPAEERRDRRTFSFTKDGVRNYHRTFLVVTDTKTDGPQAILAASNLPQFLDPYSLTGESDGGALATDVDAKQLPNTPLHWEVDVTYSSDVDTEKQGEGGGPSENDGDPLLVPDVVTFGFETFRIIAVEAINQDDPDGDKSPIENSAKQPFDPPAIKDESRPILTVVRNQLAFDPLQAIAFQDAINQNPFIGADAKQVKVKGIAATKEIQPGNPEVKFWRVTFAFVFRKEGWDLELLDHGTRIVDPNDADAYIPYVENGVVTDVKLDGAGGAISKVSTSKKPKFLTFQVYEEKDFDELGIDQTLGIEGFNP